MPKALTVIDRFQFWEYPVQLPDLYPEETNVYDMRLTAHEDGWIYGIFCSESLDPNAAPGDLSSAVAKAGIIRTKDLKKLGTSSESDFQKSAAQCRTASGIYKWPICFIYRPQDNFINAGNGRGIGWALIDDITHAEIKEETIINHRHYHTIKR